MLRTWEAPKIIVEEFVPNEYVSACGDSGTTYWFNCDAGGGKYGGLYLEDNNVEGLQKEGKWVSTGFLQGHWEYEADTCITTNGFHACPEHHEVTGNETYENGYYTNGNQVIPVLIYDRQHATTALDPETWETAKS